MLGKDRNIIAVREGNKLIHYIKDIKRYKNCIIYNYEYIGKLDDKYVADGEYTDMWQKGD